MVIFLSSMVCSSRALDNKDAERAGVPNGRRAGEKFCHPGGAGEALQKTGGAGRVT